MRNILPKSLSVLAENCPTPLYAVGGSVRDFLCGLQPRNGVRDWDICSPLPAETFVSIAKRSGFTVKAVYKNTGTVKLADDMGEDFEYSCFRSDKYVRGVHVPVEICFTDDIVLDAKRRDFTANAVYYHLQSHEFVDPLGGIPAIRERRLTTVAPAKKVFGEDGLRLMRLCRFAAQLAFTPDKECLEGAYENAALILDISPERIFQELSAILSADEKYGIPEGHFQGLVWLEKTGVLEKILPPLALGKGMAQRADFHKYDVLFHSLRAVLYAPKEVRLAALLHDVGKPFCKLRDGNSFAHPEEGERIAREILQNLKAPKKCTDEVCTLVALHMYDFDCKTKENKLRRFFAAHYEILENLLKLKQADFSACTDDLSVAPTVQKWGELLRKMQAEGAPFSIKQLAVNGKDLLDAGIPPAQISHVLQTLLHHAVCHPKENKKPRLIQLALANNREPGMR